MAEFKKNWVKTDELLPAQFNRIISNLEEINILALASSGMGNEQLQSLDEIISTYSASENTVYFSSWFNNVESNVSLLAKIVGFSWTKATFYPNGQFIKWSELNRLETEMEYLYGVYANIINHAVKLPITLGMRQLF